MKKIIILFHCICCILLCSINLAGGQFLKIEKIDAGSAFPLITVTFTAPGNAAASRLDEKHISVYEDGNIVDGPVTLTRQSDATTGLHLVIAIDSSKSLSKKFLNTVKSLAKDLAESLGKEDSIALYRFNDTVTLLHDFTGERELTIRNIDAINRHGKKTHLYDALYDSMTLLSGIKQKNRKIIIFTDGKDEGSCRDYEDIARLARKDKMPLYIVFNKNTGNIKKLSQLSSLTDGGVQRASDKNEVAAIFREIKSAEGGRYALTYKTRVKPDDKDHQVEIRLQQKPLGDTDSARFHLAKKPAAKPDDTGPGLVLPEFSLLISMAALFCILLCIVIVFFINREKRIIRDKFELENKLLLEKLALVRKSEMPDPGILHTHQPAEPGDPESLYVKAWLAQKDGLQAGKKHPLSLSETTVGRGTDNSIVINEDSVSDHHAKIRNIGGAYHLFDMLSEGGIYLNGKKLLRPKQLYDWDQIKLGSINLIFRGIQNLR